MSSSATAHSRAAPDASPVASTMTPSAARSASCRAARRSTAWQHAGRSRSQRPSEPVASGGVASGGAAATGRAAWGCTEISRSAGIGSVLDGVCFGEVGDGAGAAAPIASATSCSLCSNLATAMAAPSFWEPPCALRALRESSCARAGDGRGSVGGSIVDELILLRARELHSPLPSARRLAQVVAQSVLSQLARARVSVRKRSSVAHNARRRSSAPLAGPNGACAIRRGLGTPPPPTLLPPPQRLPRVAAAGLAAARNQRLEREPLFLHSAIAVIVLVAAEPAQRLREDPAVRARAARAAQNRRPAASGQNIAHRGGAHRTNAQRLGRLPAEGGAAEPRARRSGAAARPARGGARAPPPLSGGARGARIGKQRDGARRAARGARRRPRTRPFTSAARRARAHGRRAEGVAAARARERGARRRPEADAAPRYPRDAAGGGGGDARAAD